ncbi:alcohol dehydrogenase [Peptoclostridium litorale DSM 5388]|uniref:Alcohol dehydrogenase n=1 Tax=Peptoclostridium litorale DSM 5388 TaxID=1121324 RepID=A0A069RGZ7_PEPLI|nr:YhdH/YhfP family quinone oxidoreductase [Peptoclostridium litorale]KDR96309.1 alcohol dehydrogenase [Peptoclostridium litorale DSM 5388]SIO26132.1 alcohol dehydrogenase [Peptoclostridium litorale DSM 5388]
MQQKFKSVVVSELDKNKFTIDIVKRDMGSLPEGDVLIKVKYSSLNYKDALSASGNRGVTKSYPHTPGIDAAGVVAKSGCSRFTPGDNVIVTGFDLGMNTSGGFSEYIRVPSGWVLPLPQNMSLKDSMMFGTAGLTAALSVYKIVSAGVTPKSGDILVTGATGGVGSCAVAILSKLGYQVTAATGKMEESDMLMDLGASNVVDRRSLADDSGRLLLKEAWAGVVDTVGGEMLSTALKSSKYGAAVTCCGNVTGHDFNSSIYPFILRGVNLFGIDSVQCPMYLRTHIWDMLSSEWSCGILEKYTHEISLEELESKIDMILNGRLSKKTIVNLEL